MRDIRGVSAVSIAEEIGEPKFRGAQILGWISKGVHSFDEMVNIPIKIRKKLAAAFYLNNFVIVRKQQSQDGTIKVLGKMTDGSYAEAVLMKYAHGLSACISSQVGCKMGCTFCASTVGGLVRNITAGEMLGQILELTKICQKKISNIVLMGIGEPLDNLEEVLKFIEIVTDPDYYGISARSITVSTSGIVSRIRQLADKKLQITLAISLHNPFDEERQQIMPVAKAFSIKQLIDAAQYYFKQTGRRVTYEYAVIKGQNDQPRHAHRLGELLQNQNAHVNLIPINPVQHTDFVAPSDTITKEFRNILKSYKINSTIRRELGSDIDAACGQLRNKVEEI